MKTHLLHTKITIWLTILSVWSISAINSAPNQVNQTLQADKIVFAVIGDYGDSSQAELDVANLVKGWNPDFIVTLGDNNYPNGAPDTIDENIGQYYHEYIFPYRGTYGAGAANKRFFPALGNHDWMTNGAKPYFNYFSFYNEIGYYDFTKGEVHFFVLDSDPKEPHGILSTSEQAKWLRKSLAASSSDFNIVVFHHAPFSSGKHGSTLYMQWPFKAWGADAIISGHDHLYERIDVDGLPYFVNGVGGAELYSFGTTVPGSQIRFNQDYGAMRVETGNSSLKFQFYTRAGILIDEYTIRRTVPIVSSVSRLNSNPSNSSIVNFLVTFSEAVTGVDASDFSLFITSIQDAAINGIEGSGNTYTVSANTGTGDGTIRLDLIDNDSIVNSFGSKLGENGTGNGNYIVGETYSLDKSAPSVISITRHSPNPTLAEMVEFLVTFSEPVTGLDQTDIFVNSNNGASINAIIGPGNIYIVSVNTGSGVDALRVDLLDDDSITDQAGNKLGGDGSGNGSYLTGEAYDVDRAAPFVTSIIRAGTNPSNATNVDFIVTFSESVKGVEAVDFALMTTNINNAFVSSIHNSDPFYVVTVNSGIGTGTLRLDLVDDDSITDLTGNQLGNPGVGNGTFTNGEAFDVVKSPPIVTSVTRANANPSNSLLVDWVVTFSDPVSGVDATDFSLNTSNISGASIINVNGSGDNYTVSANTGEGDGGLRLDIIDDDSIVNGSGSPLGNIGTNNGSYTNSDVYTIDKTSPVVTSIICASANPSSSASIDFIVTFSEEVTGVDASDFNLTAANLTGASINSINNADPFYIVTVNTGIDSGTISLELSDDDSIADSVGNKPGGQGGGNGNFVNGEVCAIEKSFPIVTSIIRSSPNPSNSASVDFIVTFSEPVTGVDISDFNLSTTNIMNASITNVINVDPFYLVSVNTGMGTGLLRLDLIDDDSIANYSGGTLGGQGSGNGNFVNGEFFSISKAAVNFPSPTLRDPRQNYLTNNSRPAFSWDKVRGASAYEIMIASDSGFTQIVSIQAINGLSYTSNISLNDNIYYWRVRAYNSSFQPGKFSKTYKFTIDTTPPPAPNLLSPPNNTTTTKPYFSWEKISSATRYQIEIDNNFDYSSPEWSSILSDTAYHPSNMHRGTYYWRVRSKDMAGNWGVWSIPFTIKYP